MQAAARSLQHLLHLSDELGHERKAAVEPRELIRHQQQTGRHQDRAGADLHRAEVLLDPAEECLQIHPPNSSAPTDPATKTIALMDKRSDSSIGAREAIYASLALDLDTILRGTWNERTRERMAETTQLLDADETSLLDSTAQLHHLLLEIGQEMSYGLEGSPRSLPIALAASLVPKDFPQYGIMPFLASAVEAVFEEIDRKGLVEDDLTTIIEPRHLAGAPKALSTEASIDDLMKQILQSQAVWGCRKIYGSLPQQKRPHKIPGNLLLASTGGLGKDLFLTSIFFINACIISYSLLAPLPI